MNSIICLIPDSAGNIALTSYEKDLRLLIGIPRDWVETRTTSVMLAFLYEVKLNPFLYESSLEISFLDFEDDPREIFEIQEIKDFCKIIFDNFPTLPFFLCKTGYDGFESSFQMFFAILTAIEIKKISPSELGFVCDTKKSCSLMQDCLVAVQQMLADHDYDAEASLKVLKPLRNEHESMIGNYGEL